MDRDELIGTILRLTAVVSGLSATVHLLLGVWPMVVIGATLVAASVAGLWLLPHGYGRSVRLGFLVLLTLLIALPAPLLGGSQSPFLYSYPLVVMITVFLLGSRAAAVVFAFGLGVGPVFAWLEGQGLVTSAEPVGDFVPQLLLGLSGLVFAYYPSSRWTSALALAREHEEAAIRALAARDEELVRRAEVERELQKALEQVGQASKAKSQFLANMSHELRTPLNAILGYAEMLQEEADDPDTQTDLGRIRSSGSHLLTLINDVLDLSKIEAGRMQLRVEEVDLAQVVQEVTKVVEPAVLAHGNRLVVEAEGIGVAWGDSTRVRQVLLNLLSNAAKFTEGGEVRLTATAAHHDGRDVVEFSVSDTGVGISDEQLSRLFRAFVQADGSTSRKHGGTGLGLVLSRRFARMMGGEVTAQSVPGEGSTFRFVLPRESAAAEVVRLNRQTLEEPSRGRPTVLCVDDEAADLVMLHRMLSSCGYRAVLCSDPREAVEQARALSPAAIVLDLHMSELSGEALLGHFAEDALLALVPVVLSSIDEEGGRRLRSRVAGMVRKPVERGALAQSLQAALCADDDDITRLEDDVSAHGAPAAVG